MLGGLCAVVAQLGLMVDKQGAHWWNFFDFYHLYGFISCAILVLVAASMRRWVMRDEYYYD